MNNTRRNEIQKAIDSLASLKETVESIADEEQEYLDNIPENLMSSDRYEKAEEALSNINYAIDYIDDVINSLEEAQQ